jgi:hypothetical protein
MQWLLHIVNKKKQDVIEQGIIYLSLIQRVYDAPEIIHEFFFLHHKTPLCSNMLSKVIIRVKEFAQMLLLHLLFFLDLHVTQVIQ